MRSLFGRSMMEDGKGTRHEVPMPSYHTDFRDLPQPNRWMSPEEKGRLLQEYLRVGKPVAGLDFTRCVARNTNFEGADCTFEDCGAALPGVRLLRSDLSGSNFCVVDLQNADFRGARLLGCSFNTSNLAGAAFHSAKLTRAVFDHCKLTRASFGALPILDKYTNKLVSMGRIEPGAFLCEAEFIGCEMRDADLEGAALAMKSDDGRYHSRARVDAETHLRSKWSPDYLQKLFERGLSVVDPEWLPDDARWSWIRLVAGVPTNSLSSFRR